MTDDGLLPDQLLSTYEVVRSARQEEGRPYQQTSLTKAQRLPLSVTGPLRLKDFKNWNSHWYAESHVEEWVSRNPETLFGDQAVLVVGSQNYAHLPEKIDVLFLDAELRFHVVEVKAEHVAFNRGLTPDQLCMQMNRYVHFILTEMLPYPSIVEKYYGNFTSKFYGYRRNLIEDFNRFSGKPFAISSASVVRTFVTEGYDPTAVSYFRNRHDGPGTRLVYYKFYVSAGYVQRHFIEFWEVPLLGTNTLVSH